MPCLRRGVCTPISSTHYECDCPKGYFGKTCEKSSISRWLQDRLILGEVKKQKLALYGKLIWGVVNNIPFLHDTALRFLYTSGSDLGVGNVWQCNHVSENLDVYYNNSFITRGLPPVPLDCPTPIGIKGPRKLPDVSEVFNLVFKRKKFKPCSFGTNLMFVTFSQYLSYQFFKMCSPENLFPGNHNFNVDHIFNFEKSDKKALRSWVNGKLKSRVINGEEYPPYLEDAPGVIMHYPPKSITGKFVFPKWAMSHKMLSVTPMMFAMATVWLREHNRVCDIIIKEHPDWGDQRIYETARWIVLGELLTITAGEYFQHLAQYRLKLGYKPHLFHSKPIPTSNQMEYEFSLAFQWHHMLPDILSIHGKLYNMSELMFSNNRIVFEHGLDAIVDSMSRNPAGQITERNCGSVFENTMKKLIEEGRKTRLRSFNDYRRFYGLEPYKSFLELVDDESVADYLETLYGDIDAVEFVVGIFIEKHSRSVLPPTMLYLTFPVALREILNNPLGSPALWRPSTFGGKTGFDIVQKATLKKLFCLNLKGNCKNNVWVSFRVPKDVTALSRTLN